MKKFLTILIAASFVKCSPTILIDKNEFKAIPKGTSKIVVTVPYDQDSLFTSVAKLFAREGCPVETNKTSMQIYCNGKSVEGGAALKSLVYVDQTATGGRAVFTGQWGLNQEGQVVMKALANTEIHEFSPVKFEGTGTSKNDVVFQRMLMMAKQVPGGYIRFEK